MAENRCILFLPSNPAGKPCQSISTGGQLTETIKSLRDVSQRGGLVTILGFLDQPPCFTDRTKSHLHPRTGTSQRKLIKEKGFFSPIRGNSHVFLCMRGNLTLSSPLISMSIYGSSVSVTRATVGLHLYY